MLIEGGNPSSPQRRESFTLHSFTNFFQYLCKKSGSITSPSTSTSNGFKVGITLGFEAKDNPLKKKDKKMLEEIRKKELNTF